MLARGSLVPRRRCCSAPLSTSKTEQWRHLSTKKLLDENALLCQRPHPEIIQKITNISEQETQRGSLGDELGVGVVGAQGAGVQPIVVQRAVDLPEICLLGSGRPSGNSIKFWQKSFYVSEYFGTLRRPFHMTILVDRRAVAVVEVIVLPLLLLLLLLPTFGLSKGSWLAFVLC